MIHNTEIPTMLEYLHQNLLMTSAGIMRLAAQTTWESRSGTYAVHILIQWERKFILPAFGWDILVTRTVIFLWCIVQWCTIYAVFICKQNRIDKCIFRRSWAPLWPETTTWWGAFLQEVAWLLQRLPPFMMAWFLKWQGTKGTTATTAMWKLIHGGQQSRSHRHGDRQSAGVQLRTRRRFGMVPLKKYIIQSLKVPLTVLPLTFFFKKKCRPFGVHFNW